MANSNLPELISLCDHPKIQKGWKPTNGDHVYFTKSKSFGVIRYDGNYCYNPEDYIFLPVGFHPDTGKLQIVELIEEAMKECHTAAYDDFDDAVVIRNILLKIKELIS